MIIKYLLGDNCGFTVFRVCGVPCLTYSSIQYKLNDINLPHMATSDSMASTFCAGLHCLVEVVDNLLTLL